MPLRHTYNLFFIKLASIAADTASRFPSRRDASKVRNSTYASADNPDLDSVMVTPDPHVDELRLMSYEPRPSACKVLYQVPRRQDFKEVLWCLDDLPGLPDRWCTAEVLHVSATPDQGYLAKGVILYLPGETWDEQIDNVEFLDDHKLRSAASEGIEEQKTGSDNEKGRNHNPSLQWRFRKKYSDISQSEQEDHDWDGDPCRDASTYRRNALIRADKQETCFGKVDVEMKTLRKGQAALVVEVEKIKRELTKVSHHLQALQKCDDRYTKCTSAECVLPRLRQKLALKMQAGLKQVPATIRKRKNMESDQTPQFSYMDRVHRGALKARVECTLLQFDSLSRQIRCTCDSNSVFFFPDFSYTQLPLQSSTEFHVLFKTFSLLCDMIGVLSSADKKEMARKCGRGTHGDLLRLLGTYSYDEEDEYSAVHFYPGASCDDDLPSRIENTVQSSSDSTDEVNNCKADQLFPVLTRRIREWNRVDSRYRYGLHKELMALPPLREECSDLQAFAITWRRAAEVGGKAWSQSLCDSGEVFGWLDISLPFVQTQGRQRCQELGGLANDDVWDHLLRRESVESRMKTKKRVEIAER